MGHQEEEKQDRGEPSPNSSIRPQSRTNSEHQHFDEISLDSPDLGEEKSSSAGEKNNNTMKASYDVTKASKAKVKEKKEDVKSEEDGTTAKTVPFFRLFRFANRREIFLVILGIISAIAGGCSMPVMIILFGKLADAFVSQSRSNSTELSGCYDQNGVFNIALPSCDFDATNFTTDKETFYNEISQFAAGASIIGVVNLICSYMFVTCLNNAAESQVFRIRNLFLKAVLRWVSGQ